MFRVPARFRLADLHPLRRHFDPIPSFDDMGLLPTVRQALNELQAHKPTAIQSIAIPQLLLRLCSPPFTNHPPFTNQPHSNDQPHSNNNLTVMSAETGTGKTLSYLLPLVQQLKRQEQPIDPLQPRHVHNYLRAAILLPTNELVDQVYRTLKTIAHNVKLRVDKLGHGHRHRMPCDLIVGTPSKFLGLPAGDFKSVQHVVVDEADTLLSDPEFKQQIDQLLAIVNLHSLVYCSATITDAMLGLISPGARDARDTQHTAHHPLVITTSQLHQPKPKVSVRTIVVKAAEPTRFSTVIKQIDPTEKTIVFCNSSAVAARLYTAAQLHTSPILLHGGIPELQRAALLHAFRHDPTTCVMIATDLMARGVDLPQVRHVVLCELPASRADYLHRVGRVGRAGLQRSRGRVTVVIGSRQVSLARRLVDGCM